MIGDAKTLLTKLTREVGLSPSVVSAAWPQWWSEEADQSISARTELRFSLARKLGLDPRSLISDDQVRFVWDDSAKFKGFRGKAANDKLILSSYGMSIGSMLLDAIDNGINLAGMTAHRLREIILSTEPFVRLSNLMAIAWTAGIPVIHLQVYPLMAKRMSAMSVSIRGRYAVLLAHEAKYPAMTTFHLAHEIGHIVLGHVVPGSALVDMGDIEVTQAGEDEEEAEANRFALELLTGAGDFQVSKRGTGRSSANLAKQVIENATKHNVEPGILALCYGYSTGEWDTALAAMPSIYTHKQETSTVVNAYASSQLRWSELSLENASFIRSIMGL